MEQTYYFASFLVSNFSVNINIDGVIHRFSEFFGHFVTVDTYQDLHKLNKSIYSVRTTLTKHVNDFIDIICG